MHRNPGGGKRLCPATCRTTLRSRYDIDLRDDRELALERLTKFCRAGFVSVADFRCVVQPPTIVSSSSGQAGAPLAGDASAPCPCALTHPVLRAPPCNAVRQARPAAHLCGARGRRLL